jgi:D-3-phosphoglycerate dehydrogenase
MRILLTHSPSARARYYGERAAAQLGQLGELVLNPDETALEGDALVRLAQNCDVIVADRQVPAPAALFAALPRLAAFMRCAMDIRTVDVEAASQAGVLVTRATAGFMDSVAELAVGLMVDLARGVSAATCAYRDHATPEIRMGRQLSASTLGIIGFGAIGRRLGELGHALRMTVLAADPHVADMPGYVTRLPLQDLLARADFVVCLAPAVPETRHLMDARAFAAMRQGSLFINLARGELVDEAALAAALDGGHLAGAALDVGSAADQMPAPALAARRNVIATPHIGGLTPEAVQHQAFDTVRQAAALGRGEMPDNAVNPATAFRLKRLGVKL